MTKLVPIIKKAETRVVLGLATPLHWWLRGLDLPSTASAPSSQSRTRDHLASPSALTSLRFEDQLICSLYCLRT